MEKISKEKQKKARKSIAYFIAENKLGSEYAGIIDMNIKAAINLGLILKKQNYTPEFSKSDIENGVHLIPDIIERDISTKEFYQKRKKRNIVKGFEIKEIAPHSQIMKVYAVNIYDCYIFQYGGKWYILENSRVYESLSEYLLIKIPTTKLLFHRTAFGNEIKPEFFNEIEIPLSEECFYEKVEFEGNYYILGDIARIGDVAYHFNGADYRNKISLCLSESSYNSMVYYNLTSTRRIVKTNDVNVILN